MKPHPGIRVRDWVGALRVSTVGGAAYGTDGSLVGLRRGPAVVGCVRVQPLPFGRLVRFSRKPLTDIVHRVACAAP